MPDRLWVAAITAATLFIASQAFSSDIHSMVDRYADKHGVPRNIAHAVIRMESNYQTGLRGKDGEYGIGQIMCPTARGEGLTGDCSLLLNPETNLNFSMSYLAKALQGPGDLCARVSRYNFGIHRGPVCTQYGRRVEAMAK